MKNFDERLESIRNRSQKMKQTQMRKRIVASSCAAVFMAALLLTLFVPYNTTPPSTAKYKDSPYYEVIQKLNVFNYRPPQYKNNFQALLGNVKNGADKFVNGGLLYGPGASAETVPGNMEGSNEMPDSYVEVTDNQVAGVIESDIFKRTDKHIFHLHNFHLNVYTIAGEESRQIASLGIPELLPENLSWYGEAEMYLSQDGQSLTLVMGLASKEFDNGIVILNLDVSDPANIKESGHMLLLGSGAATRMVDGQLLVNYHSSGRGALDFGNPETYVPQYGWFDDLQCIPAEDILCPEEINSRNYSVIMKLDGKTLEVLDCKAMLSYSSEIYVSREHIFTTYSYWDTVEENANGDKKQRLMTTVTCIGYAGEALEVKGSFTVEGAVLNQYSMDEHEGTFRIVTSTQNDRLQKNYGNQAVPDIYWESGQNSANLYVVNMADWSIAGKVEGFAPKGEEVTSVRFEDDTAYVCTALKQMLMDPVYFFDLSDPANITWTDTGEIDGFSSSLVNFGNGNLLGIGYNDWRNLKIEVYREEGEKVVSVCSFEPELEYYFSEEYKSYYIDRENQLIGLAVWSYKVNQLQYLLLHFDGSSLTVLKELDMVGYRMACNNVRADMIDGLLYVLNETLDVIRIHY